MSPDAATPFRFAQRLKLAAADVTGLFTDQLEDFFHHLKRFLMARAVTTPRLFLLLGFLFLSLRRGRRFLLLSTQPLPFWGARFGVPGVSFWGARRFVFAELEGSLPSDPEGQ